MDFYSGHLITQLSQGADGNVQFHHGRLMEILKGRGVVKANIFQEQYGAKLGFQDG